jgi:hypothetical protein
MVAGLNGLLIDASWYGRLRSFTEEGYPVIPLPG